MLQNSTLRKLFGIAGSFLIALNSFAWGPFIKAQSLHDKYFPDLKAGYKDPLLPYIHPGERRVSRKQLLGLLDHLSNSQRADLWKALKGKKTKKYVSSEMLEKELLWMSSHWATYPFKKKVNYHETVKWTAKEIGVHKAEVEGATTFQLERRIIEKLFAKMWDKLTIKERKQILKDVGMSSLDPVKYAGYSSAALLGAMAASSYIWGFPFYILMAKTVVVVVTSLGLGTAAGTIGTIAMLCGPVGWCIAGVCAALGVALTGGPNVACTANFICAIHSIKAIALEKSKIDVSQYILK